MWRNAYVERPLVSSAADGTPIALHLGMGRHGYEDCCNWPQLFCTGAPGEVCGPTLTPPPPPPPPTASVRLANGGQCLGFNFSGFPCSGAGPAAGCPLVMMPCVGNGTLFSVGVDFADGAAGAVMSGALEGAPAGLDVDCDSAAPHALVKLLASGFNDFVFEGGRLQKSGTGACLNTGQGPATPPCGPKSEVWLPNQVQLAACADASAQGWSLLGA